MVSVNQVKEMADGRDFQCSSGAQKCETASENACILYLFHTYMCVCVFIDIYAALSL